MANLKNTTIRGTGTFSATVLHGNATTATKILDESLGSQVSLASLDYGFYSYDPATAGNIEFTDLPDNLKNKNFYLEVFCNAYNYKNITSEDNDSFFNEGIHKTIFLHIENTIDIFNTETGEIESKTLPLIYIRNGNDTDRNFWLQGYAAVHLSALNHGHYVINGFDMNDSESETYTITARNIAANTQLVVNDTTILTAGESTQVPKGSRVKLYAQSTNTGAVPQSNVIMNVEDDISGGSTEVSSSTNEKLFFVTPGSQLTISTVVDEYYKLDSLTVDNISGSSHTIDSAKKRYEVVAVVSENTAMVDITQPDVGATIHVEVDGVDHTDDFQTLVGKEATVTIVAEEGYNITSIMWNGQSISSGSKVTIQAGTNTASVTAVIQRFNVNITQPEGGTITATVGDEEHTNTFTVDYGTQVKFTVTPEPGYTLNNLMFGSVAINNGSTMSIVANVAITAKLTLNKYTVTITQPDNGEVVANANGTNNTSNFEVDYGTTVTITATSETGYEYASITVDGEDIKAELPYSYVVRTNSFIVGTTQPVGYMVTITQPENGEIKVTYKGEEYKQSFEGDYNENITINVTAPQGYEIGEIKLNGSTISNGSTHAITGSVTITAEVTRIMVYVYVSNPDLETIQVNHGSDTRTNPTMTSFPVPWGDSITVTMNAIDGFTINTFGYRSYTGAGYGSVSENLTVGQTNTIVINNTDFLTNRFLRIYTTYTRNKYTVTATDQNNGVNTSITATSTPITYINGTLGANEYWYGTELRIVSVTQYGITFNNMTIVQNSQSSTVNAPSTSITVEGNTTITNSISLNSYPLTVGSIGNATVVLTPIQTAYRYFNNDNEPTAMTITSTGVQSGRLYYGTYQISITPDENYKITSSTFNSTSVSNGSTISVTSNSTMSISTELDTVTLQVTKPDNANVTINDVSVSTGSYTYNAGTTLNIRVQPKTNYQIDSVLWNGSPLTATETIMLRSITVNQPEHGQIELTCAEAGLDKEVGTYFTLLDGMQYKLELVPDSGYTVDHLDVSPAENQSSTVGAYEYQVVINSNSTLVVNASLAQYQLVVDKNQGDNVFKVSINGVDATDTTYTYDAGTEITLLVSPVANVNIADVKLDGVSLEASPIYYRQLNITQPENGEIQVTCAAMGLNKAVGNHFNIIEGSAVTIEAVADEGYTVNNLDVSPTTPAPTPILYANQYTFTMTGNHTLTFELTVDVSITQPENGRIEFTCAAIGVTKGTGTSYTAPYGSQYTVEAIANSGYEVSNLDVTKVPLK